MASAQSKRTYTSRWDGCISLTTRFYDMNTTFRSAATTLLTTFQNKPQVRLRLALVSTFPFHFLDRSGSPGSSVPDTTVGLVLNLLTVKQKNM